ncbi:hypothetical protein ACJZ2D_014306 [Fusarium nematophilum]
MTTPQSDKILTATDVVMDVDPGGKPSHDLHQRDRRVFTARVQKLDALWLDLEAAQHLSTAVWQSTVAAKASKRTSPSPTLAKPLRSGRLPS